MTSRHSSFNYQIDVSRRKKNMLLLRDIIVKMVIDFWARLLIPSNYPEPIPYPFNIIQFVVSISVTLTLGYIFISMKWYIFYLWHRYFDMREALGYTAEDPIILDEENQRLLINQASNASMYENPMERDPIEQDPMEKDPIEKESMDQNPPEIPERKD